MVLSTAECRARLGVDPQHVAREKIVDSAVGFRLVEYHCYPTLKIDQWQRIYNAFIKFIVYCFHLDVERFCKIRKKLRIYGRFQLFSTNFVNNLGRMPIPPTAWDAWYGQDAHTSYGVGAWYGQDAHTS